MRNILRIIIGGWILCAGFLFSHLEVNAEGNQIGWLLVSNNPDQARRGMAAAYDMQRQVTVMFGGFDNQDIVDNKTWEFDGNVWKQITTLHSPTARFWHGMAYDAQRKVVVLFGGTNNGQYPDDTWEYDGTDWIQVTTAYTPGGRVGFGMVYDSCREKVVVYGGGEYPKGTWEYDGVDWTEYTPETNPGSRYMVSMTFDEARCRTVVFGGDIGGGTGDNETWEYDGVNWVKITTAASPLARWGGSLAYDPKRGKTVLFGGYGPQWPGGIVLGDTWEYNGINWVETSPTHSPSPREQNILVYQGNLERILLFGGFGSGETWLYGIVHSVFIPLIMRN